MTMWRPVLAGLVLLAGSAPALAEEPELSANAALLSDYRYRGVSLSDRGPAVQGGLDLEGTGWFVGTLGSTIAEYRGSDAELDVYAGLRGGSDALNWYAGGYYYLYPGGEDASYGELIGSLEAAVGPVSLGVQTAWSPPQNGDPANKYLGASADLDVGNGFGLLARGGYEDGFYDRKWDWELGASYARGPFTASLSYVDTNRGGMGEDGRLARGGVVVSLLAEF